MAKEILKEPCFVEEIQDILRNVSLKDELLDKLSEYHENDIASAVELLTSEERKKIYQLLDVEYIADIFSYMDNPTEYLNEMDSLKAAMILSKMDSDDVVDIIEDLDKETQERIVGLLDDQSSKEVKMILSYDDDEIGSNLTTNFIIIHRGISIKQATRELISQAGENDNISTIYVIDENNYFYGAIDLIDLIVAREYQDLEDLITTSYPYVYAHEKISDCIERLKDYEEDSIPVLSDDKKILGVITAHDIVEVVDEEMGDDYAKLAGLTAKEDLKETTFQSMKKRLPWLIILLFLGMGVSSIVGIFETVVAVLPIVICFQSLILDMSGNVGTQSLAVTIRVLMDENLLAKDKIKLIFKELKVGFSNGLVLGILSFVFIGLYITCIKGNNAIYSFEISACVGVSIILAMAISSLVGTLIPLFFNRIHVDPAVASGPLITTVNDLVAIVTYYGISWILLINILHMH